MEYHIVMLHYQNTLGIEVVSNTWKLRKMKEASLNDGSPFGEGS